MFPIPLSHKSSMISPEYSPVLSNGLGVESVAIILRWLLEPEARDFPLEQLTVVTAMVGAEWPDTGDDFEKYILPLFREHRVRFVQVARKGHLEKDGIAILDDSRATERLYLAGSYTLTQELESAGTVPQYGSEHRCSLKFKAFVIETWMEQYLSGLIRHTFGYNADELDRVAKCDGAMAARVTFGFNADELDRVALGQKYDRPSRISHYPLVLWGWNRQNCLEYIYEKLGVIWRKSACRHCPFARITADHIARQKQFPRDTAMAMFTERLSLAMNQRGQLYKGEPLYQIVLDSGNTAAIDEFNQRMSQLPWAVYRVRRIYKAAPVYAGEGKQKRLVGHDASKKGTVDRCVEKAETLPTAAAAIARLHELAESHSVEPYRAHDLWYAHLRRRESTYPTTEEFLVAAPATVDTKARYGVEHFDEKWASMADLYCGHSDLPLFSSLDFDTALDLSRSE
jgi:hypothetical protein